MRRRNSETVTLCDLLANVGRDKMAGNTTTTSSVSRTQTNPLNCSLHKIIRYKEDKCSVYDGKIIKWSDTLKS